MADERSPWTSEEYAELAAFGSDWRDSWWNSDFLALMSHRWDLSKVGRMLDVGCGAGHWGQRLAPFMPADAEIFGVDLEEDFAAAATQRAKDKGLAQKFNYRGAPAEALPFPDAHFDFVTCQTVMIHVADPHVALREMLRVLKPGGLIGVAEPNNVACLIAELLVHPRPAWPQLSKILELQHFYEIGKRTAGRGENSIGDLLPGYFAQLGMNDIQVYTNDRSPALFPPYESPEQKLELETWSGWYECGVWTIGGPKDNTRKLYLAGGGDESRFDELWSAVIDRQQSFLSDVKAKRLHGGRGFVCYLVSGRKPG